MLVSCTEMSAAICERTKLHTHERSTYRKLIKPEPARSSEQAKAVNDANDIITSPDMVHQVLGLESTRPIFVTDEALEGTDVRGKDISNLWVATWDGDFVKVEDVLGEFMRGECSNVFVSRLAYDETTIFSSDKLKQDALNFKARVHEDWLKIFGYAPTFEINRSYEEMVDNCQISGQALEDIFEKLPAETLERIFGKKDNLSTTVLSDREETSLQPSSVDEMTTSETPRKTKDQYMMQTTQYQEDNRTKREYPYKPVSLSDESF